MPSKEAMELASRIHLTERSISTDGVSLLTFGMSIEDTAKIIDTALAKARLEGVKAMQEEAAITGSICVVNPKAREWIAKRIRAIDPQQVINESMEK